jgi:hypothetical protein
MTIQKFGHEQTPDGPGSTWLAGESESVTHEEHVTTVGDVISDQHFDVFIKYGYAEALVNGQMDEEYAFWRELYERMQRERTGADPRTSQFDKLIKNIESSRDPLDKNLVIPVDKNYEILDGSHRLACVALFGKMPRVKVYSQPSHMYNRQWFEANGFPAEGLVQADRVRAQLHQKYSEIAPNSRLAIIWGIAIEYWDDIIAHLGEIGIRRAFMKDFESQIEQFIIDSYEQDGMSDDRIRDKARKLSEKSSVVGLAVVNKSEEDVLRVKKNIRDRLGPKIEGYFFDCIIHVIDDKQLGMELFRKFDIKK